MYATILVLAAFAAVPSLSSSLVIPDASSPAVHDPTLSGDEIKVVLNRFPGVIPTLYGRQSSGSNGNGTSSNTDGNGSGGTADPATTTTPCPP